MQSIRIYFKKIVNHFFQGLLLIAPVFVTIYSIFYVFNWLDTFSNNLFEFVFHFRFPGLGLLSMLALITIVGMVGSSIFLQPFLELIEKALEKTPVVKDVYSSIKDFASAFLSNKKKFNKPVMVEMGKNSGVFKLGFITDEMLTEFSVEDKVAVYFPHSYNFSGNLFLINKDQVQPLKDVKASHLMKYIVSGGVMEMDEE